MRVKISIYIFFNFPIFLFVCLHITAARLVVGVGKKTISNKKKTIYYLLQTTTTTSYKKRNKCKVRNGGGGVVKKCRFGGASHKVRFSANFIHFPIEDEDENV